MFKLLLLFAFCAMAMARPGFLHHQSHAPLVTTSHYQQHHVAHLPAAVHVVEPLVTTHHVVTPILHAGFIGHDLHHHHDIHHDLHHDFHHGLHH